MATPPTKVPGRTYSTFKKAPPKKGYAPGDVLKLGPNQEARFTEGLGYYAGPKTAAEEANSSDRQQGTVAAGQLSTIESPAQIEER
jgi:hypothetical protein